MSENNNDDVTNEAVALPPAVSEPTLRARMSTWLGKRPLASVVVAAVIALLVGIVIGSGPGGPGGHERRFGNHQQDWRFGHDEDGRGPGPGMMGPDQGGPGMMGPGQGGPGQFGPGSGGQVPPAPQVSPSAAKN